MKLLSSKPLRDQLFQKLTQKARAFEKTHHRKPKLVVLLIGNHSASVLYTQKKGEAAKKVGFDHQTLRFPETVEPKTIQNVISELNQDPTCTGILIQRPLPPQFSLSETLFWIHPKKDVDGFHPENVGKLALGLPTLAACTPKGILKLLHFYGYVLSGKTACILGRSDIVGKPLAFLLLQQNATLLWAHSKSKNIQALTQQADFLFVAIGKAKKITSDYIKPGAVLIDVGIHKIDGKLCGDIHAESVLKKASALTPVPGGVGPMTIACLLENTLEAAWLQEKHITKH